LLKSYS